MNNLSTYFYPDLVNLIEDYIKDEVYYSYYDNGNIKEKETKQFDKIIKEEEWYENGQKEYSNIWKDGERNGLSERWYENGQKQYSHMWKDGKENGLSEG